MVRLYLTYQQTHSTAKLISRLPVDMDNPNWKLELGSQDTLEVLGTNIRLFSQTLWRLWRNYCAGSSGRPVVTNFSSLFHKPFFWFTNQPLHWLYHIIGHLARIPGSWGPVLSAGSPQLKSEENQGQCSVLRAGRWVNTEHRPGKCAGQARHWTRGGHGDWNLICYSLKHN